VLVGNTPGLILSIWLNFCAIKLQYYDHTASIMRKSMASFLKNTRESIRASSVMGASLRLEDVESIETAVPTDAQIPSLFDSKFADISALVLGLTATETIKAPAPQEKILIVVATFWLFIFSLVSFLHVKNDTKVLIVGVLANVNNLFFYAAPLTTIVSVFRTRNSVSIHRRTMIMNTANGTFWFAYGLAVSDIFLIIPNGIGTILGVFQIVLCILFPSKAPSNELLDKSAVTTYGTEEDVKSSPTAVDLNHTELQTNSSSTSTVDYRKSTVRFSLDKSDLALDDTTTAASVNSSSNRKSNVRFSTDSNKGTETTSVSCTNHAIVGEQDGTKADLVL